jgi:hypothetical protein
MRDTTYSVIRWTYITPTASSAYDNANTIKMYNTFIPNTQYKASANTIKYSPNMEYYLIFTSDGVLELHQVATTSPVNKDKILWDTAAFTKGRPNAILSIQSDGNIVIYDNGAAIWSIGNHNNTGPAFLVADDNGYAVAYTANGYRGSYNPPLWINVHNDNGVVDLYNKVYVGMQTNAIGTDPQSYNRACTTATYGGALDTAAISLAQARYCASGLNLITNTNCSPFLDEANKTSVTNNAFNNYIIPKVKQLCADGYDSMYPDDPATQTLVNRFCSCKNPIGNSLAIMGLGYNPICYDQKCIDSGYKTSNTNNSRATCPTAICIQPINLVNLQVVKGLNISCNVSAGAPATTTPTTTTPTTTTPTTTTPTTTTPTTTTPAAVPAITAPVTNADISTNPADPTIVFTDANIFTSGTDYAASMGASHLSPNGKYKLIFQNDGNLVLYAKNPVEKSIWATGTNNPLSILSIGSDGNINIYSTSAKTTSIWTTNTGNNNGPCILAPDNNGNVVVYQSTSKGWVAIWSSMGLAKYTPNSSITVIMADLPKDVPSGGNFSMSTASIIGIVCMIIFLFVAIRLILVRRSAVATPNYNVQPQMRPPMANYNMQPQMANYNMQPQMRLPMANYNVQPQMRPPMANYNVQPMTNYNMQPMTNYNMQPMTNYNMPVRPKI